MARIGGRWFGAVAVAGVLGIATPAPACGGFFCSFAQPVNQDAERIIFSDNGDGTMTAVIQILYEGPAENFSWLLPIPSVPEGDEIAVASDIAFQRLQQRTNPAYNLTTRVEGTCRDDVGRGGSSGSGPADAGSSAEGGAGGADGGVTIEASGVVGAFEWIAISLDENLTDPSDAAVSWLETNGYDVPGGARSLLRPYLEDGLYLLALRLRKGSDTGSIRPIVLTYDGTRPSIPVRPTAVAANENMGVMAWVLSGARSVPWNYLSLELNEARINWFNPSSNYDDVVIAAADHAGGHGFVTEYADQASALANAVFSTYEQDAFDRFTQRAGSDAPRDQFLWAYYQWGSWDGFWEAVAAADLSLPAGMTLEEFKTCPGCYWSEDVGFSTSAFSAALEENVIEPVRRVQALLDARPYVTRLYTTLSASEMTVDPLFTYNPDLAPVSNLHTAVRVIECSPSVYQSDASWRIELPQGDVVRGTGEQAANASWPSELDALPPNLRILQQGESGPGRVLEDNSEAIGAALDEYNRTVPSTGEIGVGTGGNGSGGALGGSGGRTARGGASNGASGPNGSGGNGRLAGAVGTVRSGDSGGCACALAPQGRSAAELTAFLVLALSWARRRHRRGS